MPKYDKTWNMNMTGIITLYHKQAQYLAQQQ